MDVVVFLKAIESLGFKRECMTFWSKECIKVAPKSDKVFEIYKDNKCIAIVSDLEEFKKILDL